MVGKAAPIWPMVKQGRLVSDGKTMGTARMKIAISWVQCVLLCTCVAFAASATTATLLLQELDPDSSRGKGIDVHLIRGGESCGELIAVWVSVPDDVQTIELRLGGDGDPALVIEAPVKVIDARPPIQLSSADERERAWATKWNQENEFLRNGLRAGLFCLAENQLNVATVQVEKDMYMYRLRDLSRWLAAH